ncbi:hypothetical protein [Antrihabitans cavernicola]|uniref:Uncharacterized protein n=1 Tax=Antrihabitans cavernicola TaxID=2495913 RepID=A0A5A7S9I9_9NOCA|nr:hypothetical protein [Spelaeibacter cavernicola]KAA0022848.1 hypothetical protein FOY51_10030 [Spelaeibacter cavernicola]
MSWNELHQRRDVLETILERAETDPSKAFDALDLSEVHRLFGGVEGLLLALQHRWTTHLNAKLDQAMYDCSSPNEAWDELVAEQPALRAVLDAHASFKTIA